MNKLLFGDDVIKNGAGYALVGFNRRVLGSTQSEAFKYSPERVNRELDG
ncbi:hypothetical protein LCGC14_0907690, partial [marine sediment metagenome]